jgi:hypothetical protein
MTRPVSSVITATCVPGGAGRPDGRGDAPAVAQRIERGGLRCSAGAPPTPPIRTLRFSGRRWSGRSGQAIRVTGSRPSRAHHRRQRPCGDAAAPRHRGVGRLAPPASLHAHFVGPLPWSSSAHPPRLRTRTAATVSATRSLTSDARPLSVPSSCHHGQSITVGAVASGRVRAQNITV